MGTYTNMVGTWCSGAGCEGLGTGPQPAGAYSSSALVAADS